MPPKPAELLEKARAALQPATTVPIPIPIKLARGLLWRRSDIEAWKCALFGAAPPEAAAATPEEFVDFRQLAGELRLGARALRRRVAAARAAAAAQAEDAA